MQSALILASPRLQHVSPTGHHTLTKDGSKEAPSRTTGLLHLGLEITEEYSLDRQMVAHHVGIELRALALGHHRALGHHHVLFGEPGGKMEALFHQ